MGDVRFDYEDLTARWFDYWLKGEENGVLTDTPRVQYYTMGLNQWQSADSWTICLPRAMCACCWMCKPGQRSNAAVPAWSKAFFPKNCQRLEQARWSGGYCNAWQATTAALHRQQC